MAKVKIKTKKAVAARFKVTKSGKLKRTRPGRRHILTKKSSNRKRKLRKKVIYDSGIFKTYENLLGLRK